VQTNNATTKRIERLTLTYPAPNIVVLKAFVRYRSNSGQVRASTLTS
jgi:hypothetical protein